MFNAHRVILCFSLALEVAASASAESAIALNNRGSAHFAALRLKEAETTFQQAIAIVEAAPAPAIDRLQQAAIYANLAAVYRAQARYREAEPLYRKSLEYAPDNGASTAAALRGLALLYAAEDRYDRAEAYARRAIELLSHLPGETDRRADATNELALVVLGQGRLNDASEYASQALALARPNGLPAGHALNTLGRIALNRKSGPPARDYLQRAAAILTNHFNEDRPELAAVQANLGSAYSLCGEKKLAERELKNSLALLESIKGPGHPDVAAALTILGTLYENQKNFREAKPVFERALAIDAPVFGERSSRVAVDWNNLGTLAFFEHRWSQAETYMNRALTLQRRVAGDAHRATGEFASSLAVLYFKQQRYAEAKPLLQLAIAAREANDGPDDPTLGKLFALQARVFRAAGSFSEAAQAETRSVRITVRSALRNPAVASGAN